MDKHPVFYSDLMSGTVLNSPLLKNARFKDDAGEYAEIENGMIVHIGALDGERDVHIATAPTAIPKRKSWALSRASACSMTNPSATTKTSGSTKQDVRYASICTSRTTSSP